MFQKLSKSELLIIFLGLVTIYLFFKKNRSYENWAWGNTRTIYDCPGWQCGKDGIGGSEIAGRGTRCISGGTTYVCEQCFPDNSKGIWRRASDNYTQGNCGGAAASPQGGQHSRCLGSKNKIMTDKGEIQLANLKIGDRVLTMDGSYSTVFHIRNHGFVPCPHIKFTFSDNETIIITNEHLVYDKDNKLVRAGTLDVGDSIYGSDSAIAKREMVLDIPLTPILAEGNIEIAGRKISCWSDTVENAKNLNALMEHVKNAYKSGMAVKNISDKIHEIYEIYHANGKKLDQKINTIALEASKNQTVVAY